MAELVAEGPERELGWRRTLPSRPVTLGRVEKCEWEVPWDAAISRLHATLAWERDKLRVRKESTAKNPILFNGQEVTEFVVGSGQHFLIGETRFSVVESDSTPSNESPLSMSELTCSPEELAQVRYSDAADRVEVLARLPALIRHAPSDADLEKRVCELLLSGVPGADAAAVIRMGSPPATGESAIDVRAVALRAREANTFRPSRRLAIDAVRRRRQPVLHSWAPGGSSNYTVSAGQDWALCAPLPDAPSPGWALYLTGQSRQPFATNNAVGDSEQKQDLKFVGLVADLFGALRQLRDLQRRQATLESFLSPTVVAALSNQDVESILRSRQADVTVLFCDLRGFSRLTEKGDLATICEWVSEALGVMTRNILDKDGVISDFQGDAAMGFWGWPLPDDTQVEKAARAALAIRREFRQFSRRPGHPLAEFNCGIGLAHGPAIAGRLGTMDQGKVGVFGPVVNLASRLESLTKSLFQKRSFRRTAVWKGSHTPPI